MTIYRTMILPRPEDQLFRMGFSALMRCVTCRKIEYRSARGNSCQATKTTCESLSNDRKIEGCCHRFAWQVRVPAELSAITEEPAIGSIAVVTRLGNLGSGHRDRNSIRS